MEHPAGAYARQISYWFERSSKSSAKRVRYFFFFILTLASETARGGYALTLYDEDGAKIRKDENYEKNYLLGKYGAILTLKYFDLFKEE